MTKDEFRKWVNSSRRKTKPFAEYKNVKVEGAPTLSQDGDKVDDQDMDARIDERRKKRPVNVNISAKASLKIKGKFTFCGKIAAVFQINNEKSQELRKSLASA